MVSKGWLKNFSLLLGSTLFFIFILFLIGEMYFSWKYHQEHDQIISKLAKMENGLCLAPSSNPLLIYTFSADTPHNSCRINSHGYKDFEHSYQKPPHTFRVIVIGDSVAQGYGISLEETFGKVLERHFQNPQSHRSHKVTVEVIILARAGYSTNQELILLETEGFKYSPDLIIWSYILNDPADPVFHNANGDLGKFFHKPKFHSVEWVKKQAFLINEKRKKADCPKEYHEMLHCVYWDQVASHVARIGKISKEKGIPILFVIHPVFKKNEKDFKEYSLGSLHSKISDLTTMAGLLPIDILDVYTNFTPDELRQSVVDGYDPWHPNTKGHRIIADYLYTKIQQGKYLEQRNCIGISCREHI